MRISIYINMFCRSMNLQMRISICINMFCRLMNLQVRISICINMFCRLMNLQVKISAAEGVFCNGCLLIVYGIGLFKMYTLLTFTATRGSNGPKSFSKRLALLYYHYLNNKISLCSSTNHFSVFTYCYKSWNNNTWLFVIFICNPKLFG